MNFDLHTVHAHIDMIQEVTKHWLINNLWFSCSNLRSKCELLHNSLDNLLGDDVEDRSDNGSDSEEVC